MNADIRALVNAQYESIVALRRYFHMYPELSGREYKTQQKIIAELQAIGLVPRVAAETGVIADIQGAFPGKTIAIRADIDALNLQDENEQPYRSQHQGICHACGHDGHTAMLIGIAKVIYMLKDTLSGTVRLIFQPCEEEFPGGALPMIKDGALAGVDAIIGAHLWQSLAIGSIGITYGRMMASPDRFVISIQGKGGHGSMPHQTTDALLAGAQIAVALNTVVSRNIDPLEPAVLSLGVFQSGSAHNIIPDTAVLKGTIRTFTNELREKMFERIEQIVHGICAATLTTYTIEKTFGFLPVVNDPKIVELIASAGADTVGAAGVLEIEPVMGGEDFSYYQGEVPGAFLFIGTGNEEAGIIFPQHHPKFDIDERALAYGMEVMIRVVVKFLQNK